MTEDFWGIVPVAGRGSLPFSLIHGEALVSVAVLALETAGLELLDDSVPWDAVQGTERGIVLHDPLCPLTPPDFLAAAAATAESGAVVAGVRPVTDTVKSYDAAGDGRLGGTVDREQLVQIVSPIVLPAAIVAQLAELPHGRFEEIVDVLRQRWPVRFVEAPPLARRVDDPESVQVLEALSRAESEHAN